MKECKYCGSTYSDELNACPNCGGTLIVTEKERAEEETKKKKEAENRERAEAAAVQEALKRKKQSQIIAICVVVFIAIAIGSIIGVVNRPLSNGMSKDEANAVLEEGISYYKLGNFENALECFDQLPSDSKQYLKAQALIKKSAEAYCAEILARADRYVSDGNFASALKLLRIAMELLPSETRLSDCFQNTAQAYTTKTITEAEECSSKGDYKAAHEILSVALVTLGECGELTDKIAEIEDEAIMHDVGVYEKQKDYTGLVSYLQELVLDKPNYQSLLEKYQDTLVNTTIDKAKSYAKDRKFKEAISVIEKAQAVYACSEFQSAIEKYTDLLPKKLTDCYLMDSRSTGFGTYTDSFGKEHDSVLYMYGYRSYAIYNLDKKYQKLSGSIISYEDNSLNDIFKIKIYADNKLVYTSPTIYITTAAKKFDIDITNVKVLKIEIQYIEDDSYYLGNALIDAMVS